MCCSSAESVLKQLYRNKKGLKAEFLMWLALKIQTFCIPASHNVLYWLCPGIFLINIAFHSQLIDVKSIIILFLRQFNKDLITVKCRACVRWSKHFHWQKQMQVSCLKIPQVTAFYGEILHIHTLYVIFSACAQPRWPDSYNLID